MGWNSCVIFLPDIAKFDRELVIDLMLDGEVKLLTHAGPEVWIQAFTGAGGDLIYSGVVRLT